MTTQARHFPRPLRLVAAGLAVALAVSIGGTGSAGADGMLGLGTATGFAVLGGTGVTNSGLTVVNGDLGVSPDASVTGFPPGLVNGATYVDTDEAAAAQADLTTAYLGAAGMTPATTIVGGVLDDQNLQPGVYSSGSTMQLSVNGSMTLDAGGDPDAVFVFQVGSGLIIGNDSVINLDGLADPCNIFWQVTSSAELGSGATFVGSILALQSITLTEGTTVAGRLLARNGNVTLIDNVITAPSCAQLPAGTTTSTTSTTAATTSTTAAATSSSTAVPAPPTTDGPVTTTGLPTGPGPSTPSESTTTMPWTNDDRPPSRPGGPGEFPPTGSNSAPLALSGLLAVTLGVGFVIAARRSRRPV